MRPIHNCKSGARIFFDQGKFDSWCVYLARPTLKEYAPLDTEYFTFFSELSQKHSTESVYASFRAVYEATSSVLDPKVSALILSESARYGSDSAETEIWLAVIYGGMVAEENKTYAVLKKRIKHLGVHQVLMQGFRVSDAANWSRGRKWREIDKECRRFGI